MARLVPWQDLAMIFPELARSDKILQDLTKIFNLGLHEYSHLLRAHHIHIVCLQHGWFWNKNI